MEYLFLTGIFPIPTNFAGHMRFGEILGEKLRATRHPQKTKKNGHFSYRILLINKLFSGMCWFVVDVKKEKVMKRSTLKWRRRIYYYYIPTTIKFIDERR